MLLTDVPDAEIVQHLLALPADEHHLIVPELARLPEMRYRRIVEMIALNRERMPKELYDGLMAELAYARANREAKREVRFISFAIAGAALFSAYHHWFWAVMFFAWAFIPFFVDDMTARRGANRRKLLLRSMGGSFLLLCAAWVLGLSMVTAGSIGWLIGSLMTWFAQ